MSSEILRKYIDILNEQKPLKEDLITAGILGLIGYALLKFTDAWAEYDSDKNPIQQEIEKDDFYVFRNGDYMTGFRIGVTAQRAAEIIKNDIASNHNLDYNTTYTIKHQGKVVFRFNLADADKNLNDFTRNFIAIPDTIHKAPQATEPEIKKTVTSNVKSNVASTINNDPRAKYRTNKTNKYFKP